MTELKPCPFCGYASPKMTEKRSGSYRRTGDMFQILCGKCKARGPIFTGKYLESGEFGRRKYTPDSAAITEAKQKAIEAWNRRANEDTVCGAWLSCWNDLKNRRAGDD